ncbi:hypothetical protein PanWU01x14_157070 [Parasponia andersonii]|uniref:Uncharacterized protein n=1 Tax=Parasponia andersonii TaxID=3476 RepID=A0A2P5CFJ6_PARAD|nr:hypothetical protein PanWU01x14_157070 [Parasponia andersonii]
MSSYYLCPTATSSSPSLSFPRYDPPPPLTPPKTSTDRGLPDVDLSYLNGAEILCDCMVDLISSSTLSLSSSSILAKIFSRCNRRHKASRSDRRELLSNGKFDIKVYKNSFCLVSEVVDKKDDDNEDEGPLSSIFTV